MITTAALLCERTINASLHQLIHLHIFYVHIVCFCILRTSVKLYARCLFHLFLSPYLVQADI